MLTFEPEGHVYRWNGVIVPSVTQILEAVGILDLSMVDRDVLAAAQELGKNVHKICELYDKGTLDESSVDGAGRGYLDAWIKARKEMGFDKFSMIERKIYHPDYKYAGTLDRVYSGTVIDIKTGAPGGLEKSAGPQLAAYMEVLNIPKRIYKKRLVIHLTPDDYKPIPLTDIRDLSTFISALNIWNHKKRR